MPERVADLEVGLVLLTAPFLKAVSGALDSAASLMTQWGTTMSIALTAPLTLYGKSLIDSVSGVDYATRQVLGLLQLESKLIGDTAFDFDQTYQQTLRSAQDMAMEFGAGVEQVLDGIYFVVGTGFETVAEAEQIMQVALKASVAGATTAEQAVRAVVGVLNAYGLGAEYAQYVSDQLFMTVNKGNVTFEELTRFIGRTTTTAATMGVGLEELGAIIADVTRKGEWARRGITNLEWVLRAFIVPSKEAAEIFAVALNMDDTTLAADRMRKMVGEEGLLQTLRFLRAEVGENIGVWGRMFRSAWAMRAVTTLLADDFDGVTEMLKFQKQAMEGLGATQEVYEVQADSLRMVLERLKAQAEVLGITLGFELARMLAPAVDFLGSFITVLREMPSELVTTIVKMGLFAAAIPPMLLGLGQLLRLGSMVISTVLNPMAWAFAALAFAVWQFVRANYEIRDAFDAIVALSDMAATAMEWGANAITQFALGMIDAVSYVVKAIGFVADAIIWFLAPGSEPRALEGITDWGRQAIEMYLNGMTQADLSVVRELARYVGSILGLRDAPWQEVQHAYGLLLNVLDEYRETGKFSEGLWGELAGLVGDGADQLREWLGYEFEILDVERDRRNEELAFEAEEQRLLERQERIKKEIEEIDRRIRDLRREQAAWDLATAEIPERFKAAYRRTFQLREAEMNLARDSAQDRADATADEIDAAQEAHKFRMEELDTEQQLIEDRADSTEMILAMEIELAALRNQQMETAKKHKETAAELVAKLKEAGGIEIDWEKRIGPTKAALGRIREAISLWELFFKGFKQTGMIREQWDELTAAEQRAYEKGWEVRENFQKIEESATKLYKTLGALGIAFMAGLAGEQAVLPFGTSEETAELARSAHGFGESLAQLGESLGGVFKAFEEFWDGLSPQMKSILLTLLGLQITTGIPGAVLTGLVNLALQLSLVAVQAKILAGILGGAAAGGAAAGTGLGLLGSLEFAALLTAEWLAVLLPLAPILLTVGVMAGLFYGWMKLMEAIAEPLATKLGLTTDELVRFAAGLFPGGQGLYDGLKGIESLVTNFEGWVDTIKTKLQEWGIIQEETETKVHESTGDMYDHYFGLYLKLAGNSVFGDIIAGAQEMKKELAGVEGFRSAVDAILREMERLTNLRNLGNRIVDSLVGGLWENMHKVGGWVGSIVRQFEWLSRVIWGHSIIPEMTEGITEEFEMMRRATVGELDLMRAGVGGFASAANLELAPAAAGFGARGAGPAVEANFYNHWDASLSAKDRAELMAAAEDGTYQALSQLFGTVQVGETQMGGRQQG